MKYGKLKKISKNEVNELLNSLNEEIANNNYKEAKNTLRVLSKRIEFAISFRNIEEYKVLVGLEKEIEVNNIK